MFNILDAVHMPVDVNIAIECPVFADAGRVVHFDMSGFGNRTFLVVADVVSDVSAVQGKHVGGRSGFNVDQGPD